MAGHGANRKYKPSYRAVDNPVVDAYYWWKGQITGDMSETISRTRETQRKTRNGKQDAFTKVLNGVSNFGTEASQWVAPTDALDPTSDASVGDRLLDLAMMFPLLKPLKAYKLSAKASKGAINVSKKAFKGTKNSKFAKSVKELTKKNSKKIGDKFSKVTDKVKTNGKFDIKKIKEMFKKASKKDPKKIKQKGKGKGKGKGKKKKGKGLKKKLAGAGGYGLMRGGGAGGLPGLLSRLLSGLMGGGEDPKGRKQTKAQRPKGKKAKKVKGKDENGKPLTNVQTNAKGLGKKAKKLGSACCSNDKQETIKIHAFRSSVDNSLEKIAEAEESQAESLKKATKKTQNDPRTKRILNTIKGLGKSIANFPFKNLNKAVKMGIMGLLGSYGILYLVGFIKRMGGWFGIKEWLIEAVNEQVESIMDAMKSWWNEAVIGTLQTIFTRMSVLLEKIGLGDGLKQLSEDIGNSKYEVKEKDPIGAKGKSKNLPNTAKSLGLVSKKKNDKGHRKINSLVTAKYYQYTNSDYGMRQLKGQKERFHGGVDLPLATGTPITSLDYGIVTVADNNADGAEGKYVSIYNPRTKKRIMYMHLESIDQNIIKALKADNKNPIIIKPGDPIGLSGATGTGITGAHLHLQVKDGERGSTTSDPITYVENATKFNMDDPTGALTKANPNFKAPVVAKKATTTVKSAPATATASGEETVTMAQYTRDQANQKAINKQNIEVAIGAGQSATTDLNGTFYT